MLYESLQAFSNEELASLWPSWRRFETSTLRLSPDQNEKDKLIATLKMDNDVPPEEAQILSLCFQAEKDGMPFCWFQ